MPVRLCNHYLPEGWYVQNLRKRMNSLMRVCWSDWYEVNISYFCTSWTVFVRLLKLCRRFIRRCKQGCLQFVILKPMLVAVTLILYAKGKYHDGDFSARQSYLYLTIIYTFSYTMALYALAVFYVACRDLLQPFNPVPKFIIIKSVVFLTYWQVGVFLNL